MATKKKTTHEHEHEHEHEPEPAPAAVAVETLKTNPVEPTEPYPTGTPHDPEDGFAAAHGYRRDQPKE